MTTTTYSQSSAVSANAGKETLLRRALYVDVISAAVTSILFLLASSPIADFLGITDANILGLFDGAGFITFIGIATIIFGLDALYIVTRPTINTKFAWSIAITNFAWVIISWILLATGAIPFSDAGNWAVMIAADVVLMIGIADVVGIRRINR